MVSLNSIPRHLWLAFSQVLGLSLGLVWLSAPAAGAITVTTTADELNSDGDCSLREAIQAANQDLPVDACPAGVGDDSVLLPSGVYTLTLSSPDEDANASGDLDVLGGDGLTIIGSGPSSTVIHGSSSDRVLHVHPPGAEVQINGVQIAGGRLLYSGSGAGILNAGNLTLENCMVRDNSTAYASNFPHGGDGGGIYNIGTLTMRFCTVAANQTGGGFNVGRFNLAGDGGRGGGIYNAATLTITHSTVAWNHTGDGGSEMGYYLGPGGHGGDGAGIYNTGSLYFENATVSSNTAGSGGSGSDPFAFSVGGGDGGDGAGIYNVGFLQLDHVTLSGNAAGEPGSGNPPGNPGRGGGLFGVALAKNTLIGGNQGPGEGPDCFSAPLTFNGYNLIQDIAGCSLTGNGAGLLTGFDPLLGPLGFNGGATYTHTLRLGSPAIDAGSCQDTAGQPVSSDQRGVFRPQGAACDIGAFEFKRSVMYVPLTLGAGQ